MLAPEVRATRLTQDNAHNINTETYTTGPHQRLPRGATVGPVAGALHMQPNANSEPGEWLPVSPHAWIHLHNLKDKIQHSCAPNSAYVSYENGIFLECIRPIPPNTPLTVDYTVGGLFPHLHPQCTCPGAIACSGPPPADARPTPWHARSQTVSRQRLAPASSPASPRPVREAGYQPYPTLMQRVTQRRGEPPPIRGGMVANSTPGADAELCIDCLTVQPEDVAKSCLTGEVVAAWLYQWAARSGVGFDGTMPAAGQTAWIAHPDTFTFLRTAGAASYCVWNTRTSTLRQASLWDTDGEGRLLLHRALVPVYIPPKPGGKVGHWILASLGLKTKQIRISDWIRGMDMMEYSRIGALVGRWWDDSSRIHSGLSWNAQAWPVEVTFPSEQRNGYDCGVHMLSHITTETGARTAGGAPGPSMDMRHAHGIRAIISEDLARGELPPLPPAPSSHQGRGQDRTPDPHRRNPPTGLQAYPRAPRGLPPPNALTVPTGPPQQKRTTPPPSPPERGSLTKNNPGVPPARKRTRITPGPYVEHPRNRVGPDPEPKPKSWASIHRPDPTPDPPAAHASEQDPQQDPEPYPPAGRMPDI